MVTVTITIASCRQRLLTALYAAVARAPQARVTGCVSEPTALLSHLAQRPPSVLVIDQLLLEALAPCPARAIREAACSVRVLMVCDDVHPAVGDDVLRDRFHGFVSSESRPETWVKAIGAVSRGELWLPRAVLQKALSEARQQGSGGTTAEGEEPAPAGLTPRETQIVEQLRWGLTNKEIASRLGIREDTVKKHLHSVFGKLGVRRRTLLALGHRLAQARVPL